MSNPSNLPYYSTLAQLRNIPLAAAPQYPLIYVSDGSSTYKWNAGDTSTDNNWTIIKPTGSSSAGRWNRVNPVPEALNVTSVVNLKDWMDITYGAGNWTYYTGKGLGTDAGPAITAACTYLRNNFNRGTLYVPSQTYRIVTPPDPNYLSGNLIVGDTAFSAEFVFDNGTQPCFWFNGAGGYTGGGIKNIAAFIEDGYGSTSTAQFLLLQGDATFQPDQFVVENLYISAFGTSYWANGFNISAQARTAPQGCRVGTIKNYQQFRCSTLAFRFANAVQWTCENLGAYVGVSTGMDCIVTGGGTTLSNTTQTWFWGCVFGGAFQGNAGLHNGVRDTYCNTISGGSGFSKYFFDVGASTVPGSNPFDTTAGTFHYSVIQW